MDSIPESSVVDESLSGAGSYPSILSLRGLRSTDDSGESGTRGCVARYTSSEES